MDWQLKPLPFYLQRQSIKWIKMVVLFLPLLKGY